MAQKKFTDLPAVTALTDDDIFPLTDAPAGAAATKKIVVSDMKAQLRISSFYPIEFMLDEGGGQLSTGGKVTARIYEAGNINHWVMSGDHSTGVGVNIFKGTVIPVSISGTPIVAMGFSAALSAENNSLSVGVAVGDYLRFVTQKVNTVTQAAVALRIVRT